jgi:transcriptional regulator with XRE-family HTH domain
LETLPDRLRKTRLRRGLSLRQAGEEIGVNFTTVRRIETGEDASIKSAVKVLAWLDGKHAERQ